ncbi:MAG: lipid-A-disaccharide synthase, partial [Pseudomonadota bacterium]
MKVAIIAGEESGDTLGSALMEALSSRADCTFMGIGGADMAAKGLTPIFPMHEISVMGIDA